MWQWQTWKWCYRCNRGDLDILKTELSSRAKKRKFMDKNLIVIICTIAIVLKERVEDEVGISEAISESREVSPQVVLIL